MANTWWRLRLGDDFARLQAEILARVRDQGPVMAREISETEAPATPGGAWWGWRPSKTVLEFMWRTGTLAVTLVVRFQKIYDLTENVIPAPYRDRRPQPHRLCRLGLRQRDRPPGLRHTGGNRPLLGFGDHRRGDRWCAGPGRDRLRPVAVDMADGGRRTMVARADLLTRHNAPPAAPGHLRLLSPFDPLLRDRSRAAPVRLRLSLRSFRARRPAAIRLLRTANFEARA